MDQERYALLLVIVRFVRVQRAHQGMLLPAAADLSVWSAQNALAIALVFEINVSTPALGPVETVHFAEFSTMLQSARALLRLLEIHLLTVESEVIIYFL